MRLIAALVACVAAFPAFAADVVKGDIKISQPWSRATPGGAKVAIGYLTITNTGKTADKLIGGTSAAAGTVEVHDMTMTDGVMRMRRVEGGLEIKPGATVALKPGGLHMMFIDVNKPLKQGDKVKGTLLFEKAGAIEVEYDVAGIGASAPDGKVGGKADGGGHHKH